MAHPTPRREARVAFVALFALACLSASGAPADPTTAIHGAAGKTADFTQRFTPKGFKKEQVERGQVTFGEPPQMRWSYTSPEEKVFVFDGTTSWLYLPADQQVTIHKLTDDERRKLPFFILSDPAKTASAFSLRESGLRTTFSARDANAMLREIIVERSGDGMIKRIEYTDAQGNRTVFEFGNFRKAAATSFRFDPPAGTQTVEN